MGAARGLVRTLADNDVSWMEGKACRSQHADLFFANETEIVKIEQARDLCRHCPVRSQCLEFALANREHEGMWGGKTERERRRIRRQRREGRA